MGLDTYAVIPNDPDDGEAGGTTAPPEPFEGINLIGGMFSGGGASFRGKCYDGMVEEATGVSLYEEFIPPETVAEMADKLEANPPKGHRRGMSEDDDDWDEYDGADLVKFFVVCRENGYGLHGWW